MYIIYKVYTPNTTKKRFFFHCLNEKDYNNYKKRDKMHQLNDLLLQSDTLAVHIDESSNGKMLRLIYSVFFTIFWSIKQINESSKVYEIWQVKITLGAETNLHFRGRTNQKNM